MSRIYDALERAAADRAAAHQGKPEKGGRGTDHPPRSPGEAGWWRGLIVGGVIGFMAAAVTVLYLLARQQSSALPSSRGEQIEVPSAQVRPPAVAEVPLQPPAQPAEDTGGELTSEAAPVAARVDEPAGEGAAATPGELESSPARSPASVAPASPGRTFWVQVGAFKNRDNAVNLQARLTSRRYPATIHLVRSTAAPWVLRVGDYSDRGAAEAVRVALAREGFPGFVAGR